ncbi:MULTISPECIES: hypothetical protein [unclassified Streptomyces]|nr:hypothetical protein [Streptomyces sp. SJL17-1]
MFRTSWKTRWRASAYPTYSWASSRRKDVSMPRENSSTSGQFSLR